MKECLVVIPARGGSKGVPDKNIRKMGNHPLIHYTINQARKFFTDDQICVTTDSQKIQKVAEDTGLAVPFIRPADLATDSAGTYEVLLHALAYYESQGRTFKQVLLLQPTSPFRKEKHFDEMFIAWEDQLDMVVSVGVSHHNPYFSQFEENEMGFLEKSKKGNFARRQDAPEVFFYNGSMYLIKTKSLKEKKLDAFDRIKKYVMEEKYCFDIDTSIDWLICESLLEKGIYSDANN